MLHNYKQRIAKCAILDNPLRKMFTGLKYIQSQHLTTSHWVVSIHHFCCLNTSHPQQRPPGHYSSAGYHGEVLPARSDSATQRESGGGSGGGECACVCQFCLCSSWVNK